MGIIKNARKFIGEVSLSDFLPDWFLDLTVRALPQALGFGTAEEQVKGSIILIGWSIFTGLFTGLVTAVFVFFWGIFLLIGILRWNEWFGNKYDRAKSASLPGMKKSGKYRIRRGDD
ncbi:hypothetical protein [Natronosalvus halobius]|uniref:hypothetical protein n=1 Tax=Natronosalvus halobius TaxID=2953746 RepID=UPI00209FC805|nr:hypothetical protein [Natronosalvus halobius]USZ73793.1 hypothetical protein NGM15_18475 [Natronosalvus halobius]